MQLVIFFRFFTKHCNCLFVHCVHVLTFFPVPLTYAYRYLHCLFFAEVVPALLQTPPSSVSSALFVCFLDADGFPHVLEYFFRKKKYVFFLAVEIRVLGSLEWLRLFLYVVLVVPSSAPGRPLLQHFLDSLVDQLLVEREHHYDEPREKKIWENNVNVFQWLVLVGPC